MATMDEARASVSSEARRLRRQRLQRIENKQKCEKPMVHMGPLHGGYLSDHDETATTMSMTRSTVSSDFLSTDTSEASPAKEQLTVDADKIKAIREYLSQYTTPETADRSPIRSKGRNRIKEKGHAENPYIDGRTKLDDTFQEAEFVESTPPELEECSDDGTTSLEPSLEPGSVEEAAVNAMVQTLKKASISKLQDPPAYYSRASSEDDDDTVEDDEVYIEESHDPPSRGAHHHAYQRARVMDRVTQQFVEDDTVASLHAGRGHPSDQQARVVNRTTRRRSVRDDPEGSTVAERRSDQRARIVNGTARRSVKGDPIVSTKNLPANQRAKVDDRHREFVEDDSMVSIKDKRQSDRPAKVMDRETQHSVNDDAMMSIRAERQSDRRAKVVNRTTKQSVEDDSMVSTKAGRRSNQCTKAVNRTAQQCVEEVSVEAAATSYCSGTLDDVTLVNTESTTFTTMVLVNDAVKKVSIRDEMQAVHKCVSFTCQCCRKPKAEFVQSKRKMMARPLAGTKWWQKKSGEQDPNWIEDKMKPFWDSIAEKGECRCALSEAGKASNQTTEI